MCIMCLLQSGPSTCSRHATPILLYGCTASLRDVGLFDLGLRIAPIAMIDLAYSFALAVIVTFGDPSPNPFV